MSRPTVPAATPGDASSSPLPKSAPNAYLFGFFGVFLPAVTLLVEVLFHLCADVFFDPIPTLGHILVIACVPAANFFTWRHLRDRQSEHASEAVLLNGFVLGAAGFYTVLFLPLLPLGVPMVLLGGLGLLLLAPLAAFLAAWSIRVYLKRRAVGAGQFRARLWWTGLLTGFMLLVSLELPATVTRVGLHMAASSDPATSQKGIRWLRAYGDDALLLRACYWSPSFERDMVGSIVTLFTDRRVYPDQARTLYYRVKGTAFNAVPPPPSLRRRRGWLDEWDEEWDFDQGGTAVGQRVRGLQLAASRMESSVDTEAALSYTEWTMTFQNTSGRQREARATLKLPPGGVVSRVTLWIDGEEREAAFGERGQVREAYEKVVRRRRDPLLMTTAGPDRVLVQCFPIPPKGQMKIRIGMTAPLLLNGPEEALFRLPYLEEHNYEVRPSLEHAVWIDATTPLRTAHPWLHEQDTDTKVFTVRGRLDNTSLQAGTATIRAQRPNRRSSVWTPHPYEEGQVIHQTLVEVPTSKPERVVVVVDGSKHMAPFLPALSDALLPYLGEATFHVVFAGDEVIEWPGEEVLKGLRTVEALGGQDNVPALLRATELAGEQPNSVVLWIHGPQPIAFGTPLPLSYQHQRTPPLRLYELQIVPGPNRLIDDLDGRPRVSAVPHTGTLSEDLRYFFSGLFQQTVSLSFVRIQHAQEEQPQRREEQTSSHLARLWAFERVTAALAEGDRETAQALAVRHQLVTPVSGAVVLETQAQYEEAGLEPVPEGTVPTIPEPEVWLLLLVIACLLLMLLVKQQRQRGLAL